MKRRDKLEREKMEKKMRYKLEREIRRKRILKIITPVI